MTITQDLEFSVLTAPLAAVDRRGLSQAWYSALYAQTKPAAHVPAGKSAGAVRAQTRSGRHPAAGAGITPEHSEISTTAALKSVTSSAGGCMDRRGPRSPLARKIERAFLHPKSPVRSAAFTLEGAAGRVQVLLRARGANLKLVAICPRKAMKQVAAALEQARYALAQRGIELNSEMRDTAAC